MSSPAHRQRDVWLRVAALCLVALLLAACSRRAAPAATATPVPLDTLPERDAAVLLKTDQGGTVGLRDGAELAVPRQALTDNALVTLRALNDVPPTPIPNSMIGRAYDVSLDGGDLAGVGLLSLPLPSNVAPDQYELAAYRWDGRQWQRMESRFKDGRVQLGINQPGTYAVLGTWRMADANLGLTVQAMQSGQEAVPVEVHGQYHYSVLPTMQHDYVEARLALKRDSSGGAGQISGIEQLDQTIAETVLWFKPDPSQSEGVIDFTHTFMVDPAALGVPLGSVNIFYANLNVADSAAPTRRQSTGADYTVQVPIKAIGTDVVRPELPGTQQSLLWHVRLNGQTLFRRPATQAALSLAEVLAQGGLGEYKITLDAEYQGKYIPVSNEVTVQLAMPQTATPAAVARIEAPALPATATVWPFGTMPPTPTRRAPPVGTPSPLEGPTRPVTGTVAPGQSGGATPTATPTPLATRVNANSIFWSDKDVIVPGECTALHWNVENVSEVYFNNSPTTGNNTFQACPTQSTSYTLRAIDQQNRSQEWRVTVSVQGTGAPVDVTFTADASQIVSGACTTLRWQTANVQAVYLNGNGVAGEASQMVCPTANSTYELRVQGGDGDVTRHVTVYVLPTGSIPMQFWAEQYTMSPGSCTTLHWAVENVDEVHVKINGTDTGVAGYGGQQVCPQGDATYTLTAKKDDHTAQKNIVLHATEPSLRADEVIAQGVVNEMTEMADIDPNTPGNLPGFRVVVDGIAPIAKGRDSCCQARMTIILAKAVVEDNLSNNALIDWPIHEGQQIEFRFAPCGTDGQCTIRDKSRMPYYLRARSQ